MRVGILARKSTSLQETSIDRQIADAKAFAERKGWIVVESSIHFVPEGVSGAVTSRPEFNALLEDGARGRIQAVIVQTNDRVSRLMTETVTMIVALKEHGIAAWSYTLGQEYRVDSTTERFLLAAQGFAAEMERERLISRTSEALFYRARQGLVAGNRLYGYDNCDYFVGDKAFVIRRPNEEAKWVVWVCERFAEGWGHRRIAEELNRLAVPSPSAKRRERAYACEEPDAPTSRPIRRKAAVNWSGSTVRSLLTNESYRGVLVYGRTQHVIRKGTKQVARTPDRAERTVAPHLRLIEPDLQARVEARLSTGKGSGARQGRRPKGVLVGNLLCSTCGGRMYVVGTTPESYVCGNRHQKGDTTCKNDRRRPREALDDAFVDALAARLEEGTVVDLAVEAVRRRSAPEVRVDERSALANRCKELRDACENYETAIARATPAMIDRLLGRLEATAADLAVAEAALNATPEPTDVGALDADALRARVRTRVKQLRTAFADDVPAARETLRQLLEGPARAVPVMVNGAPKYLVRAKVSAAALLPPGVVSKLGGDPKGN